MRGLNQYNNKFIKIHVLEPESVPRESYCLLWPNVGFKWQEHSIHCLKPCTGVETEKYKPRVRAAQPFEDGTRHFISLCLLKMIALLQLLLCTRNKRKPVDISNLTNIYLPTVYVVVKRFKEAGQEEGAETPTIKKHNRPCVKKRWRFRKQVSKYGGRTPWGFYAVILL